MAFIIDRNGELQVSYIISENDRMDKYLFDESNGFWYEWQGNCRIPCLIVSVSKHSSALGDRDKNDDPI